MNEGKTRRTPLHECHLEAGGRMVPFAGWEMPVQYRGVIEEHKAVRSAVGLFDVSHMGEIQVSGRRALDFLQFVTCNDVSKLTPGRAHYTGLMTPRGTFVDDLLVHMMGERRYFLVVNAANKDKDYAYLCAQVSVFEDADVEDLSASYAQLAIQGPKALDVAQRLTAAPLAEMRYYRFLEGKFGDSDAVIARTGYTGEDGFEIYVPAEEGPRLWRAVLSAGAPEGIMPCGLGARDTLRFEACMPLYGNDIDDTTTPLEAGLDWIVKLDKGAFLGREALLRQSRDGVRRRLVGFEMRGRGIPRHGYPIRSGTERVGQVTSGTMAPSLGKALGMGYVPIELEPVGSQFEVEIRDTRVLAEVVQKPFYRRSK